MGRKPMLRQRPQTGINARIFDLVGSRGISQTALGKRVGVTGSTVSKWLSDDREPAAHNIAALAEALLVTPEFILTGKERTPPVTLSRKDARPIPLVGAASAGHPMQRIFESHDVQVWHLPPEFLRSIYGTTPDLERAIIMRVSGDSMDADFPDGSLVFIDRGPGGDGIPRERVKRGKIYLVQPPGTDGLTLKRIALTDDGGWIHLYPSLPDAHDVQTYRIPKGTPVPAIVRGVVVAKLQALADKPVAL